MAKSSNNILALGVGLNLDPLNQDIANAAKTAKEGMAVVGQSVVDGGAKASGATENLGNKVQTMRQQLRLATQDAQAMAEKYGIMSSQAIASASRAGELKDKIGDINTVITAFSADSKFTVVAGALQSAAGAASIVTGAMGLLGTESKATQEMLLKVQSALALTQGLAQIKEMGASFTALRAVVVGQVIPSIAAMGVTMNIALGVIGLLAVGVYAMVVYYNNVSNATEKWKNELEKTIKLQALQLELFKIWQSISSRGLSERAAALQQEQAIYEENKTKLIAQLTEVLAEEKKNGGQRIFAHNIVNSAIEENLRIHNEKNKSINADYDKKEKDAIDAVNKEKLTKQENQAKAALAIANKNFKDLADLNKKLSTQDLINAFAGPKDITGQKDENGLNAPKFIPITYKIKTQIDTQETEFAIKQATDNIKAQIDNLIPSVKNAIVGVVTSALAGIGEAIAGALSGDDDPFEAFGIMLIKSLGQMAVQLGSQMLAIGAAMLFVPTLQSQAAGYLLGGAALVVAGSAVSGLAGRKSQGGTQPTPTNNTPTSNMSPNSNYIGGQNSGQLVIQGYVRGNDINFVNGKSGSKNNRNLRFG
jgi:hypothetical protein